MMTGKTQVKHYVKFVESYSHSKAMLLNGALWHTGVLQRVSKCTADLNTAK